MPDCRVVGESRIYSKRAKKSSIAGFVPQSGITDSSNIHSSTARLKVTWRNSNICMNIIVMGEKITVYTRKYPETLFILLDNRNVFSYQHELWYSSSFYPCRYNEKKVCWINKIEVPWGATLICCQLNTTWNWNNYFINWKQKYNNKMYSLNSVYCPLNKIVAPRNHQVCWFDKLFFTFWSHTKSVERESIVIALEKKNSLLLTNVHDLYVLEDKTSQKKAANPLRLSIVLSHHMHRNWTGKSEAGRHWL